MPLSPGGQESLMGCVLRIGVISEEKPGEAIAPVELLTDEQLELRGTGRRRHVKLNAFGLDDHRLPKVFGLPTPIMTLLVLLTFNLQPRLTPPTRRRAAPRWIGAGVTSPGECRMARVEWHLRL